jgi:MoaA/NifB/PqqE/SkfB family radical SAM enzyme
MLNLALQYALRCNISCAHCSVSAGPKVGRRMTLEFALDVIRQSESVEIIDRVTFTGGEVLLLEKEIIELVSYATKIGKKTRIVSNGFWARNKESGRRLLTRLRRAGLTELNLSADEYHYHELPATVTANAAELLHEFDYAVLINRVERRGGDTFAAFAEKCGFDSNQLVIFQPNFGLREAESIGRNKVLVRHIGLSVEGRGANLRDDAVFKTLSELDGVCPQPVRMPSVSPEGLLFPCCSPGSNYSSFQIGNLHETPLCDLIQKLLDDPLANFITTYGPAELIRLLARRDPELDCTYSDICNLCCTALRHYSGDQLRAVAREFMIGQTLSTLLGVAPMSTAQVQ